MEIVTLLVAVVFRDRFACVMVEKWEVLTALVTRQDTSYATRKFAWDGRNSGPTDYALLLVVADFSFETGKPNCLVVKLYKNQWYF